MPLGERTRHTCCCTEDTKALAVDKGRGASAPQRRAFPASTLCKLLTHC